MGLRVDYLNHACVLLELGPVSLLSDPWLEGTCFGGGWGLCYDDPSAYARASRATHLWISHWHSDHFHAPTLKRLAELNPDVTVLANVSANFSMVERMRGFGFRRVIALGERKPLAIADGIEVMRYPTAGIDNMLLLRDTSLAVLNYNDCNLTSVGVRALVDQLGPIDVLLSSYNYAGKLFEHGTIAEEKQRQLGKLPKLAALMGARHVIPFASAHYFRSETSWEQNALLLSFADMEQGLGADDRFHILRVGDALTLEGVDARPTFEHQEPALSPSPRQLHDYGPSLPWEHLLSAAERRCEQIRKGFFALSMLMPTLHVEVTDLGRVMSLHPREGAHENARAHPHIAAHSRALCDWLGRRFGDDAFFAGAHFALRSDDTSVIKRWALVTLLEASRLDLRSTFGYLGNREGLRFLWCRREEILSALTPGSLRAAQVRL